MTTKAVTTARDNELAEWFHMETVRFPGCGLRPYPGLPRLFTIRTRGGAFFTVSFERRSGTRRHATPTYRIAKRWGLQARPYAARECLNLKLAVRALNGLAVPALAWVLASFVVTRERRHPDRSPTVRMPPLPTLQASLCSNPRSLLLVAIATSTPRFTTGQLHSEIFRHQE